MLIDVSLSALHSVLKEKREHVKAFRKESFIHLVNINKSNRFICLRAINITFLFVKETSRVSKLKAMLLTFQQNIDIYFPLAGTKQL